MSVRAVTTLLMLGQVLACPFLDCGECRGACAAAQSVADWQRDMPGGQAGSCRQEVQCGPATQCAAVRCAKSLETRSTAGEASRCCSAQSVTAGRTSVPCRDPACPDHPGPLGCLCGGAVQADLVDCPDLLAAVDLTAWRDVALTRSILRTDARWQDVTVDGCPHFPPQSPGTSLHALTQAYLL